MTRAEAVSTLLQLVNESDIVVAADGAISREAYRALDRERTFYMIGSMGQVASIALGLAMTRLERVIAIDGDGNLLMGMGSLAMVGGIRPPNLHHLVLDNGQYATTGGQPALSAKIDLAAAAVGSGYTWARRCTHVDKRVCLESWLAAPGPALLDLLVEPGDPDPASRVPMTPEQMAERFRNALRHD